MSKYKILKDYEITLMDVEDILGSGVTTHAQLTDLGYRIFKNDYLGTYSSDKMPIRIIRIIIRIINVSF